MASRTAELRALFEADVAASIAAKQALLGDLGACVAVAERLIDAYAARHSLLVFGNGGSAADAQHIAAEFVGRFYRSRPSLRAQALTVNTSALTAIANDFGYDEVFARQLEALGEPGDVAIGISTSGNAESVVRALRTARERGMTTVAMTGRDGGRVRGEVDFWVGVPATDVARIQESHIMIGHIWSELVERALYPDAASAHDRVP